MEEEEVNDILIDITEEFIKKENTSILNEQKLAASIFYSFALGVLANEEHDTDKLISLSNAVIWLQENKELLINFGTEA